jgi:hypothetical protein
MGPESILGAAVGSLLGKLHINIVVLVVIMAAAWLAWREVWEYIK